MAAWALVPCLECLRTELNALAPNRDKSSDGTIGDTAHQERTSDHNDDELGKVPIRDADSKHEVHAIDLDVDLREPNLTMEMVVQHVLARCRSGVEKRLRYVIYNRRIWEASNGWAQRAYTGENPHDHHAHFSASYETELEASTASWHLEDLVSLSDADKTWLSARIDAAATAAAERVWTQQLADPRSPATPKATKQAGTYLRYGELVTVGQGDRVTAAVAALAGRDLVDEETLAAKLAERLAPRLPDTVTPAELQAALIGAWRELVAPDAAA